MPREDSYLIWKSSVSNLFVGIVLSRLKNLDVKKIDLKKKSISIKIRFLINQTLNFSHGFHPKKKKSQDHYSIFIIFVGIFWLKITSQLFFTFLSVASYLSPSSLVTSSFSTNLLNLENSLALILMRSLFDKRIESGR